MIKVIDLLNRFTTIDIMDIVLVEFDIIDESTDIKEDTLIKSYSCFDLLMSNIGDLDVESFSFDGGRLKINIRVYKYFE